MKNFIRHGASITFTASAPVSSGEVVVVGDLAGVAAFDAAVGEATVVALTGVYELPKASAQAWTAGAKVYWDATNSVVTTTASGNMLIGHVFEPAANPSGLGKVRLSN